MKTRVFVEAGAKKTFAGALDWAGWARSGKSEAEALDALVAYGARYKRSMGGAAKSLAVPGSVDDLDVSERLKGDPGTDFGVPSAIADSDRGVKSEKDLGTHVHVLEAAWNAFDNAADKANGRELAKGPRGGGRSLAQIREHVVEADRAYIGALGAKAPHSGDAADVRQAFIEALHAKIRGELAERGPRGGERWLAGYAIRRAAWHALDHAWEIEDRSS
jgi:hypothetical protein